MYVSLTLISFRIIFWSNIIFWLMAADKLRLYNLDGVHDGPPI